MTTQKRPPAKENNLVMRNVMIFNQNKCVFVENTRREDFVIHWTDGEWRNLGWRERLAFFLLGWDE